MTENKSTVAIRIHTLGGDTFDIIRSRKLIICRTNFGTLEESYTFDSVDNLFTPEKAVQNLTRQKFVDAQINNRQAIPYLEIGPLMNYFPMRITWPEAPKAYWYSAPLYGMQRLDHYSMDDIEISTSTFNCPTLDFEEIVVSYSSHWDHLTKYGQNQPSDNQETAF